MDDFFFSQSQQVRHAWRWSQSSVPINYYGIPRDSLNKTRATDPTKETILKKQEQPTQQMHQTTKEVGEAN